MALDKNAIKGIGLLAFIGVLAASGFFVAKPQIEEAFKLSSETADTIEKTTVREGRLGKLQTENENIEALRTEVNDLLVKVPSDKNVTGIAAAVIEAMPPGVQLIKFSHGELVEGGPNYSPPSSSLGSGEPPFELVIPGDDSATASSSEDSAESSDGETKTADKPKVDSNTVPSFAQAPFVLDVTASGVESLTNYLDMLQAQDRLITIVSVTSSSSSEGVTQATIYGYAFAGSTDKIKQWQAPAETAE